MQPQSKSVQQSRAAGMAVQSQDVAKLREAIQSLAKSGVSQVKEADRATLGALKANDTPMKQTANDNQQQMRQPEQSQERGR